jgi:RNA polymerase sigma-70 factor (ECF subfamily)
MEGIMERDDRAIIAEIRRGSEAAMDELIRKYQKRVFNMIYGQCMNYDTSWDVCQETFVKAVKFIKNFREESSFWTYLYRIAMNSFYDEKRKDKVRARVSNFSEMTDEENKRSFEVRDMLNIEEDYDKKVAKERVTKALETLTDVQKEVFVLKNTEGLKIREIAVMLKISEGTVKSHLSRAMEKIKASLGGEQI